MFIKFFLLVSLITILARVFFSSWFEILLSKCIKSDILIRDWTQKIYNLTFSNTYWSISKSVHFNIQTYLLFFLVYFSAQRYFLINSCLEMLYLYQQSISIHVAKYSTWLQPRGWTDYKLKQKFHKSNIHNLNIGLTKVSCI